MDTTPYDPNEPDPGAKERKEKLQGELSEMAQMNAKAAKSRLIMTIVGVCLVIFLVVFVGQCSHNAIMSSHYNEAKTEFMKSIKHLEKCHSIAHFGMAEKFMDHVIEQDKGNAEPYIFKAAMYVTVYDCQFAKDKDNADRGNLEKAREFCNRALSMKADYPDAYYYLGVIEYYEDHRQEALLNLNKCIDMSAKKYRKDSVRVKEWQDKARSVINAMNDNENIVSVDVRPVMSMMQGFTLVQ